jgi:hypothetical protein
MAALFRSGLGLASSSVSNTVKSAVGRATSAVTDAAQPDKVIPWSDRNCTYHSERIELNCSLGCDVFPVQGLYAILIWAYCTLTWRS